MRDNPYREDREELKELLMQYHNLRQGISHSFIEEDAFERIIDYFDEKDDMAQALEASEIALEQFPYSAVLMIKKLICYWQTENTRKPWTFWKLPSFLIAMT